MNLLKITQNWEITSTLLWSDHISNSLSGSRDFEIYKSVPYGPIKTTLPYLARRALENNDVMARTKKERSLMWKELIYRIFPFKEDQIAYNNKESSVKSP